MDGERRLYDGEHPIEVLQLDDSENVYTQDTGDDVEGWYWIGHGYAERNSNFASEVLEDVVDFDLDDSDTCECLFGDSPSVADLVVRRRDGKYIYDGQEYGDLFFLISALMREHQNFKLTCVGE